MYSKIDLGKLLDAFVPGEFRIIEVSKFSSIQIKIGDIVSKKKDIEERPFVVYKSWHQGNKLYARNGIGGE